MEITKIKLEVKTLNKNLFLQLESTQSDKLAALPIIHGWVNYDKTRWFIIEIDGIITRMPDHELYWLWIKSSDIDSTIRRIPHEEALELYGKFSNKYPQIFI